MGYRLEEAGPGLYTEKICYKHRGHPRGSKDSVSSTKYAMEIWKQVIKDTISRRKRYKRKILWIIQRNNPLSATKIFEDFNKNIIN